MKTKADHPAEYLSGKDVHPLIRAYFDLCQLKQLYRQGWLRRGIDEQHCETVYETPSYQASICSFFRSDRGGN